MGEVPSHWLIKVGLRIKVRATARMEGIKGSLHQTQTIVRYDRMRKLLRDNERGLCVQPQSIRIQGVTMLDC